MRSTRPSLSSRRTGRMPPGARCCGATYAGRRVWGSSRSSLLLKWCWRPAADRTPGVARCAVGPRGAADPGAIRQARQERQERCRGDPRGRGAAKHRRRAGEVGRRSGTINAADDARVAGAPAHATGRRVARPRHRTGPGRQVGRQGAGAVAGGHRHGGGRAGARRGQGSTGDARRRDRAHRGAAGRDRRQGAPAAQGQSAQPTAGRHPGRGTDRPDTRPQSHRIRISRPTPLHQGGRPHTTHE